MILALAWLPLLLLGPAFGGLSGWIHSHCLSGGHVHLLSGDHDHAVAAFEQWHDAQHRRGHEHADHDDHEPAPKGLLIELPEFVVPRVQGSTPSSTAGVLALPPLPFFRCPQAVVESPSKRGRIRSGWPPQATRRSGVASLLRSSHAILI